MRFYLLVITITFIASHCADKNKTKNSTTSNKEKELTDSIPACIRKMINDAKPDDAMGIPLSVEEYTYNGKTVYLFGADCCDRYNTAFDKDCKEVCSPSGGIDGRGDRKCLDFDSTAKFVKTVWKKTE